MSVTVTARRFGLALIATTALTAAPLAAQAQSAVITILHVNDFDRMEEDDGRGGVARYATVVNTARAGETPVIVTHAGDAISPSLLSGFDQGAHMVDLMNQVGIDVFAIGNHEFNYGPVVLSGHIANADFAVVSANAIDADGEVVDGATATWTTEAGGFTFGFIGLTTASTAVKSSPGTVTFADPLETVNAYAADLREAGVDIVIALAHTDLGEDDILFDRAEVDLILSGDDHILSTYYNGVKAMVESSEQAEYVTEITLTLLRDEDGDVEWTPSFRTIDTATVEPDAVMTDAVQVYLDQLSAELDVEIGTTLTELDTRRSSVRGGETAFGNMVADAMREATGADIGITNGGGIRADRIYDPGTVLTRRNIQSELPFGNSTVSIELSGADVVAALENGFSRVEDVNGRFPHVSGLSVVFDMAMPAGERVVEVMVGDGPIDLGATYVVATNDFMARGGDGYAMFADAPRVIDALAGGLMAGQVMAYIAAAGEVSPMVEGRVVRQN